MIYAMLEIDAEKDWWDDVPEDAKKSIEKGLDDLKKGKVSSHKDVMKSIKNGCHNHLV